MAPLNLAVWESAVNFPSGIWGGDLAEIKLNFGLLNFKFGVW